MSWSASARVVNNDFVDLQTNGVDKPEHQDQYESALGAVILLLSTGVVGSEGKTFKVSVSGHGNPNHEPASGWANDFVSINIYQEEA